MKTILIIENIRLPVTAAEEEAFGVAEKRLGKLGIPFGKLVFRVRKKSVDARDKSRISFVYSLQVEIESGKLPPDEKLAKYHIKKAVSNMFSVSFGILKPESPIAVVGFGPAGMFCGLLLAEYGFKPIIFERGAAVDERVDRVEHFVKTGELSEDTNVQFGAGGAGTFSDGKLTTRIGDPLCGYVTEKLCELGAPSDIAWRAKPHVGTDQLRGVIRQMDARIRALGGEIRYNSHVSALRDESITVNGLEIPVSATVLAVGHSARDLYAYLLNHSFRIEPKAFSCGVRVEHLQRELDEAMYGDFAGRYGLEHADYGLSYRQGDRGVYSFCMCPGGYVMASASEEGGVVTNGMSHYLRDGENANAAIAVSVLPEDYGATPTAAIAFQRDLEQKAFKAGGGHFVAPVQTIGDFYQGIALHEPNRIKPTYRDGAVRVTDLHQVLPPFITDMLKTGFHEFGKRIAGFDASDVPLTGVETRTSAPVRILRGDELTAPGFPHVYPCGEGAGYAGGIMSAAVDGIRVALAIMRRFRPD